MSRIPGKQDGEVAVPNSGPAPSFRLSNDPACSCVIREGPMIRKLLFAFAMLSLTACGYGSAVDIAPFTDRPTMAAMPDGDYCGLSRETGPPLVMSSSKGCLRFTWKPDARQLHMVDLSRDRGEEGRETDVAIVKLAENLFAAQWPGQDSRFEILPFIAADEALFIGPIPSDAELKAIAARHPGLVMVDPNEGQPPRLPNEQPLIPKHVYIASGSIAEIRAYLREAVSAGLRSLDKEEPDERGFALRDTNGAPDHTPTSAQLRAITAAKATIARLSAQ